MTATPAHLAAMGYAAKGWRVIPITPGKKHPGINGWQNAATTDLSLIDQWWTTNPDDGVGIATGPASGIFVLDVDITDNKRGDDTLEDLELTYGTLPPTVECITGSGGRHIYFAYPPGVEIRNDAGRKLGPGLDIRGTGGQVLAPPTIHPNGHPYTWETEGDPDDTDVADAPGWLIALLTHTPTPPPRPTGARANHDSPAARYNQSTTWPELLERDGWTHDHTDQTGEQYWTRPGKERRDGVSATVGWKGNDALKVFTTSLAWLPEHTYSRFGYYACRYHQGDRSAAARALLDAEHQGHNLADILPGDKGKPDPDTTDGSQQWAEPIPLRETVDLPPFPVDALPEWIADHVKGVAAELQAPADLPATLALAALSTVTAGQAKIAIRGTWTEPANLYLVVAMPPGSGKSPAFNAMIAPLRAHERNLITKTGPAIAQQALEQRVHEKQMRKAEERGDAHEAGLHLTDMLGVTVDKTPRLIADDATPEAMVKMLGEQKGRLAILSTEGGLFDLMTGRYSDRSNLDPYLKAWSGDAIIVDRIGRESAIIENPALTVGLTVQPSVLAALAEQPELAGRGLTSRFMYSLPVNLVGTRNMIDAPTADPAIERRYRDNLTTLAATNYDTPATIRLSGDACAMFLNWRQQLENRRGPFGDMRPMSEWSTKLESSVARLALLLHVAEHRYTGDINVDTMTAALTIGAYWIEHGKAIHDLWVTDPIRSDALHILGWLEGKRVDTFTIRDAHRSMKSRFARPADLIEPLDLLTDYLWITPLSDGPVVVGRGGKPSPRFAAHPKVRERKTSTFNIVAPVAPVALKVKSSSYLLTFRKNENADPRATGATGATAFLSTHTENTPEVIHTPYTDGTGLM